MEGRLGKALTPFDLAKFQALADGGQISVRNLSVLYRLLRIDSEFYKPKYITLESTFEDKENIYPLRKYCNYIKKGIFDISPDLYLSEGTPLIRTSEIKNPFINFLTTAFIDRETHQEHYKTNLKPDDIVMTKIGAYIGDVAILPSKYDCYNFSQNVTGLSINTNLIISKYLFAFLLSKFGRLQIKRIIMLSGQGKIELEDIRDISIYEAPKDFQHHISKLIDLGQSALSKSESVYKEAQDILLAELGLDGWEPTYQLWGKKCYSETVQAGRIDAEYYQPKYYEIIKAITSYLGGADRLGDLAIVKGYNFTPKNDVEYRYIELSNIFSNGEVAGCTTGAGQDLPARARRKVEEGDVIVSSIEGSLSSIALIGQKYNDALCSNGFHVVKSDHFNSETLLVFLKSIAGQMQLKKGCNGSILTAINQDEFADIVLPKIAESVQLEIKEKVTESFKLRTDSKKLLENAKRAVEIAIEQDETAAIQFLNSET